MAAKESSTVLYATYLLGVCAMLGWNVVQSSLDFFIFHQKEYNPDFVFPMMNFILSFVFQFILIFYGNKFRYKPQIIVTVIFTTILLFILPIITISISGFWGFFFTCILLMLLGLNNAVLMCAVYGFVSFLPFKYIVAASTGMGMSGFIMSVIKIIVNEIEGSNYDLPDDQIAVKLFRGIMIYIGVSGFIMLLNVIFVFVIFNNEYILERMPDIYKVSNNEDNQNLDNTLSIDDDKKSDKEIIKRIPSNHSTKEDKKMIVTQVMVKIIDINLMIWLNFFIMMSLFPGVAIGPNSIFGTSVGTTINIIILIFSFGDFTGRLAPRIYAMKKSGVMIILMIRFIFFIIYPLVALGFKFPKISCFYNDPLILITNLFFGFTGGYCTSCINAFIPERVPEKWKGNAGACFSFYITFGVFSGSLYAMCIMQYFFNNFH